MIKHDVVSVQDPRVTEGVLTTVSNPSDWVEKRFALAYLEPMVLGTIISPTAYLSGILELCHSKRGEQREITNIDQQRLNIQFLLPLNEIVTNFYDELKSISSGYASFDYEDAGYQQSELLKLGMFQIKYSVFCIVHIWHSATIELLDLFNLIQFIPDVLLNGKQVHELSTICHVSKLRDRAKAVVFKLKNELPRQQFAIAIQVS